MSESDIGCFEFLISNSISMDLHIAAPAELTVFWIELDLRSCCLTEWLSFSQISGLTLGVVRVSQFTGRKYFADFSFSVVSDNFLDHKLLMNSASCFLTAGPESSALTKSSAISDSNGSLLPPLCLSQARGFSLVALSVLVAQRAQISASESLSSSSELSEALIRLWNCSFYA